MSKNLLIIKRMVMISILTALSLVLYIVGPKFSLPFFPSFLEINFSMLPIFIGLFMLGPVDALGIVLLRFLIKLPFTSTDICWRNYRFYFRSNYNWGNLFRNEII